MAMESLTLSPQTLIADLLALAPQTTSLLMTWHVDCLGCCMNRFCTLQEMCKQYELDVETILKKLKERMVYNESNRNFDE
jgi:hybrid cluster-associated redox disulfide protein